jgi:hypothetical protein
MGTPEKSRVGEKCQSFRMNNLNSPSRNRGKVIFQSVIIHMGPLQLVGINNSRKHVNLLSKIDVQYWGHES